MARIFRLTKLSWEPIAVVGEANPDSVDRIIGFAEAAELARHYPADAMHAAFRTACAYSTYSLGFVRGVLQHQAQPLATPPSPTGVLADVPRLAIKRDLCV